MMIYLKDIVEGSIPPRAVYLNGYSSSASGNIFYQSFTYFLAYLLILSYIIPMRHFFGVQFLNMSVKSSVLFPQLFQPTEESFFFTILK